jgi:hypothetical protein
MPTDESRPMLKIIKARILEMFTEDNGKLSLSRVTSGLVVLGPLVWVSFLVFKNHVLPDLEGPALFVTGGATHYGLGKFLKKDPPTTDIPKS